MTLLKRLWRVFRPSSPVPLRTDELWAARLTVPAARFRIDASGDEYVVELDVLTEKLKQQLADMRPELRQLVEAWLEASSSAQSRIIDLPPRWRSFNLTAIELIQQGKGYCFCVACKTIYAATEMTVTDLKFGRECVTNSTHVHCPAFHELLKSEAHFRMRVAQPKPPAIRMR